MRYLFGQAVESSVSLMRWSAQPPHLLPLLLFTAVLDSVQHGLSERLRHERVMTADRDGRRQRYTRHGTQPIAIR